MNKVSFLSSNKNLKEIAAAHFQEVFSGSEVYVKMHFGEPEIDREECIGYSICTLECPHGTLEPKVSYFDDFSGSGNKQPFR